MLLRSKTIDNGGNQWKNEQFRWQFWVFLLVIPLITPGSEEFCFRYYINFSFDSVFDDFQLNHQLTKAHKHA
jgi:membrane protease YdiL (CAAX protease family)